MALETAPFDVVEASRRVWLAHWPAEAASGMAVYTAILRSYQLLNDQVNQVMRGHGLTFSRYEVLAWLATDAESSVTLSWISRTLRIPPATVTDIIDRLERDDLVRRAPHPSDARTTLAVITPKGRTLATDATRDLNATVYERMGLTEDHRDAVIDLLAELRANGEEFDVARSAEVVEELRARHTRSPEVA
jgi:DNA-binding MarR family transcriptional regulator